MGAASISDDDDDSSSAGTLNLEEDKEWQDAENDEEQLTFVSLFDDRTFPDLKLMLAHCREQHGFDLVAVINKFDLDFLSCVKLVNYVRSEVKRGNKTIDISSVEIFQDDSNLQPVLEDDAVLFSIDDLMKPSELSGPDSDLTTSAADAQPQLARVVELEERLRRLADEYSRYREEVGRTLDDRWVGPGSSSAPPADAVNSKSNRDKDYFDSYSYNEIHETMLKDAVRTDAYRDFIYDNKDLFRDKVVLDVGCGTGILSMFCAKAGAAKVIAVENSAIIEKARVNIQKNGLDHIITCVHGKVEEVTLPVKAVDIIVSEWMGYCLLFEAMLDSVLWARDRYLAPGGLMVPSHCTLYIAPITDTDYISENISFWHEVYGFDMSAMLDKIHDDVLVRHLKPANLLGPPCMFMELPLHSIGVSDLTFSKPFKVDLGGIEEAVDGWVIWFDTFFLRSADAKLPDAATADSFASSGQRGVAFSTGPHGKETHWKSGVMLVESEQKEVETKHTTIEGTVEYRKSETDARALEIGLAWKAGEAQRHQTWFLR